MRDDFPFPDLSEPLTGPFWSAAQRGELSIPRCASCRHWVWYPKAECCGRAPQWRTLGGGASLFSWSEVRRPLFPAYAQPYIVALVVPQEAPGVRLITRLVDCEASDLRAELPLEAVFRPLELSSRKSPPQPVMAPFFRPLAARGDC